MAIPVKGDAVRTDPGPRSADDARNWTPCQFVIAACRPFYDKEICDARFVARARADRHFREHRAFIRPGHRMRVARTGAFNHQQ